MINEVENFSFVSVCNPLNLELICNCNGNRQMLITPCCILNGNANVNVFYDYDYADDDDDDYLRENLNIFSIDKKKI